MPSPFPGKDPYLENAGEWPDFHLRFINYWREAIADTLPDQYEARIDERIVLTEQEDEPRDAIPDRAISRRERPGPAQHAPAVVATLEPVAVPLPPLHLDAPVEHYIKILKRPERSLVTVLELLSPSNKVGVGRSDYLNKRDAFRRQNVSVVELDLLLRGRRLEMAGPLPPAHYYARVTRGDRRRHADVYAWTIRQPLPVLPVPLLPPDPEIGFDLRGVITTTYERARYARSIPYDDPLTVPLGEEDRRWALERVAEWKASGARPG